MCSSGVSLELIHYFMKSLPELPPLWFPRVLLPGILSRNPEHLSPCPAIHFLQLSLPPEPSSRRIHRGEISNGGSPYIYRTVFSLWVLGGIHCHHFPGCHSSITKLQFCVWHLPWAGVGKKVKKKKIGRGSSSNLCIPYGSSFLLLKPERAGFP